MKRRRLVPNYRGRAPVSVAIGVDAELDEGFVELTSSEVNMGDGHPGRIVLTKKEATALANFLFGQGYY